MRTNVVPMVSSGKIHGSQAPDVFRRHCLMLKKTKETETINRTKRPSAIKYGPRSEAEATFTSTVIRIG